MRHRHTPPSLLAGVGILLLALSGCGETFKPASYVNTLRILAIRADHPEVESPALDEDGLPQDPQPGGRIPDRSRLRALVADPAGDQGESREITVIYLACTPDPLSPIGGACTSIAALQDPESLPGAAPGGGSCGDDDGGGATDPDAGFDTPHFVGAEVCRHGEACQPVSIPWGQARLELPPPTYEIPAAHRLDVLPKGHPARILGVQAVVVAVALAAGPDELMADADPADACAFQASLFQRFAALLRERESVLALKRIQLRGPDAMDPPNVNPAIQGITAGEVELPTELDPPREVALFRRGEETRLRPSLPSDFGNLVQAFTRRDIDGNRVAEEEERWLYSWFATAGSLDGLRTRDARDPQLWIAPTDKKDDPAPADGRVFLYAVVRDGRGGIDWVMREVHVLD